MAARAPRRSFARPFVITLAAAPACFVSSSTPPSQPVSQAAPGQPSQSDPAPATPPPSQSPVIVANPPHPRPQGPAEQAPAPPPETRWTITKTATGCQSMVDVTCPAGAMCNPPPPQPYECPKMVKLPAKVTTFGKDACVVEREPVQCPPGAICNPPPPQRVPCPK